MKEIGSIKRKIQILDDVGNPISLTNLPIYVTVAMGKNVVKSFGTATWVDDIFDMSLMVDNIENYFIILLTSDEVDSMRRGKYDINVWWLEDDADFPGGKRREFKESKGSIEIPND